MSSRDVHRGATVATFKPWPRQQLSDGSASMDISDVECHVWSFAIGPFFQPIRIEEGFSLLWYPLATGFREETYREYGPLQKPS